MSFTRGCGSCQWGELVLGSVSHEPKVACHLNPPTPVPYGDHVQMVYPVVDVNWWCSQHLPEFDDEVFVVEPDPPWWVRVAEKFRPATT